MEDPMTEVDWRAIERMPEFQQLVTGRGRFAWAAGGIGVGFGALYVVLVATAPRLMGTALVGSFSLGFAGGVGVILLTGVITLAYMRRSARIWEPLEARVRERVRTGDVPGVVLPAPAPAPPVGRVGEVLLASQELK
jgi:uncharacterized membrane protein (DUF485 family)